MQTRLQYPAAAGIEAFLDRLHLQDELDDAEREAIRGAASRVRHFPAGTDIVLQHSRPDSSILLVDGMAGRYSMLDDGERQITAFHILGDFVDLHGFLLSEMDHAVTALTDVNTVEFPHIRLEEITKRYPHLTRMLWLSTIIDGAIHRQRIVSMGRMQAAGQLAHLICEHLVRAQAVGLAKGNSFPFQISQHQLSDALGMSPVHCNRTVQELRRRRMLEWVHGTVTILDLPALQQLGQFDPTYLDIERRRR